MNSSTPAFPAAAYAIGEHGVGRRAAANDMVTIAPRPRSVHPGQDRHDEPVRRDQVQLDGLDEVLVAHLLDRLRLGGRPARVGDEHVDPTESLLGVAHQSGDPVRAVRSAATAWQVPPSDSISRHTAAGASVSRPCTVTRAPCSAR